jgi:pantoate--beta-alanine ligase
MGALHEGHLSLVDRADAVADAVVVSVFVNPTQFGPDEDYEEYPRDLDGDMEKAESRGADLVFAPPASEMYPREQTVWVEPGPLADRLCGRHRPGHFRGVLTVVLKLLNVVQPDVAVFGRKDFQQSVLIRRMVEELNLPVEIETTPVVREEDGLAMSSRNEYLSGPERESAASLSRALRLVREAFSDGERDPARLVDVARRTLEEAGAEVEYVEIVDPEDLSRVERAGPRSVCAIAAHVGETRLIDNAPLGGIGEDDPPARER